MATPQQSAQAVATFLGRAGRLAVFAGLGGAALQAALYTGLAYCVQLPWHPHTLKQNKGEYCCLAWKALPIGARATRLSAACGTRTEGLQYKLSYVLLFITCAAMARWMRLREPCSLALASNGPGALCLLIGPLVCSGRRRALRYVRPIAGRAAAAYRRGLALPRALAAVAQHHGHPRASAHHQLGHRHQRRANRPPSHCKLCFCTFLVSPSLQV